MPAPWMASQDSAYSQIQAFERSVSAERLKGILRTGGGETAARRFERRYANLIESYQDDERKDQDFPYHAADLIRFRLHASQGFC